MDYTARLSGEFHLNPAHVGAVIKLLDEGNTVPFIARYRKELTGAMDDQVIREVSDRLEYMRNMDKRREEIENSLQNLGVQDEELLQKLAASLIKPPQSVRLDFISAKRDFIYSDSAKSG